MSCGKAWTCSHVENDNRIVLRFRRIDNASSDALDLSQIEQQVKCIRSACFLQIASLLHSIKSKMLYKVHGYKSFNEYMKQNKTLYGFGKRRANNLLAAYKVYRLLDNHSQKPSSERQVRANA